MKSLELQQKYLGDAPKAGFTLTGVTNDFPSGTQWIDDMKFVRLFEAAPIIDGKPNGLDVITRSYELQSMQYGRLCSIFSSSVCLIVDKEPEGPQYSYTQVAKKLKGRQHSYTQVVAFPNSEDRTAVESHEIKALLAFDDFMTEEKFWLLERHYSPKPISWEPPQVENDEKPAQLNEIQLALLCRYWRTASNRAFHQNSGLLECVCVVPAEEADEEQTIRLAKELCSGLLVPCLPKAVGNIVSMCAGGHMNKLGCYNPVALAVVVPEGELPEGPQYFDLHNNTFVPLTRDERDFIGAVTKGATSLHLEEIYQRYCAAVGNISREACTFMADYHVAFAVWYLENGRYNGSAEDAVGCLCALTNVLQVAHQLPPDLVDHLLAPLEACVYGSALKQEVVSGDNFKYLLVRAAEAPEEIVCEQMKLLALHERNRQKPSFAEAWPVTNISHERLGRVLEYILLNGYIDPPLGDKEREELCNPDFIGYCKEREPIAAAMVSYLRAYTDRHPEQGLFILPLSIQFLEGRDMLAQSLKLLLSSYTDTMPGQELLDGVKDARQYLDEKNQQLLAKYYLECFRKHRASPIDLKPVVEGIGADTTNGFCLVLDDERQRVGSQEPLSKENIKETLDAFGAFCQSPDTVRAEYVRMVDAVLDESLKTGTNRFQWLCQLQDLPWLMDAKTVHNRATDYMCRLAVATDKAPDNESFATVVGWLKSDGVTEEQKNSMNNMLDALLPQTRKYVCQTFGMFGSVENYPGLRKVLLESVQDLLVKYWSETDRYWESIEAIADGMRLGGLTLQEVVGNSEKVTSTGITLLTRIMFAADSQEQFRILTAECVSKPDSPFKTMWMQQLRSTYSMKYDQLFTACANIEEVRQLRSQAANLNLSSEIQSKEGYLNGQLALEAEQLLISRSTKQINNSRFYDDALYLTRRINQQRNGQTFYALRQILVALAQQYANCDAVGRLLMLLVPADTMEPREAAAYLLKHLVAWNDNLIRKPWADDHLYAVQTIANAICVLSRSDGDRAPLAQAFVDTLIGTEPYLRYTEQVRKNRKCILKNFPFLGKNGEAYDCNVANELKRWLGGNV